MPFQVRNAPPSASLEIKVKWKSPLWKRCPALPRSSTVSKPYKLVSRDVKDVNTVIRFPNSDATIGGNEMPSWPAPVA